MTAGRAWAILGAAITAYELLVDDDHLLTAGVRRGRARSRVANAAIVGGVVTTALHLLDALGPVDPYRALHAVRLR